MSTIELQIPVVGEYLKVVSPMSLVIQPERRNASVYAHHGVTMKTPKYGYVPCAPHEKGGYDFGTPIVGGHPALLVGWNKRAVIEVGNPIAHNLTNGDILRVERVYIRGGGVPAEYNSITFSQKIPGIRKKLRFWVGVDQVQGMVVERVTLPPAKPVLKKVPEFTEIEAI